MDAELFVLAGLKTEEGANFFSAGAADFVCELRRFDIGKYCLQVADSESSRRVSQPSALSSSHIVLDSAQQRPHVDGASSSESEDTSLILRAIEDMKVHIDARLDRIEGSLMMHSRRLSKIEHAVETALQ